jgi:hypothetical protein
VAIFGTTKAKNSIKFEKSWTIKECGWERENAHSCSPSTDINPITAKKVAEEVSGIAVVGDVSVPSDVQKAVETVSTH